MNQKQEDMKTLQRKKARFENESNNFKTKWKEVIEKGDPYSNINFDRNTAQYNISTEKIEYKE